MVALLQRVKHASVTMSSATISTIGQGLLIFLGIEKNDSESNIIKMAEKICRYRIFNDHAGKMNLDVQQIGGELLVVSQFTLAADTHKGLRPSFSSTAPALISNQLYTEFCQYCRELTGLTVKEGVFGAAMDVTLCNEGPVTFILNL